MYKDKNLMIISGYDLPYKLSVYLDGKLYDSHTDDAVEFVPEDRENQSYFRGTYITKYGDLRDEITKHYYDRDNEFMAWLIQAFPGHDILLCIDGDIKWCQRGNEENDA